MSREIGDGMDDDEIGEFLRDAGIGVLGLAADGRAYTIPVAFAFDADADRCILRLVMSATSRKKEFVDRTETASLTVTDWQGTDDWHSVVIGGPLRTIPEDEIAHAAALFSDVGEQAALDIFNRPLSAYDTVWYGLDIEEVTGRTAADAE